MDNVDLSRLKRVHMVGIGGAGMSGLAVAIAGMGCRVSGSDLKKSSVTDRLESLGILVYEGHDAANISAADLVVISAAVPEENPELAAARAAGLPVMTRAEMLGRLMSGKVGIAVAGTHGKTTTTSMLAILLEAGGLDPTVLIGGDLDRLNGNAKLGGGTLFLTEACEAFNSFLELHPAVAVVTNIEGDHLEFHGSLAGVIKSFERFLSQIEPGGCAVLGVDCPNVRAIVSTVTERTVTYGLNGDAEYRAVDLEAGSPYPSFRVMDGGRCAGDFRLRVPGRHNVQNALAAIAVGAELNIGFDVMRDALAGFRGVGRRFEELGTAAGVTVVDDYAHHPTEIRATLAAARAWRRRVVAVFQPHLYSRTRLLMREFADSLSDADVVMVTEIYPAREQPIPGVTAAGIVELINANDKGGPAQFISEKERVPEALSGLLRPGDLVVVMGAGDIRTAGELLLASLGGVPESGRCLRQTKEN